MVLKKNNINICIYNYRHIYIENILRKMKEVVVVIVSLFMSSQRISLMMLLLSRKERIIRIVYERFDVGVR